MAQNTFTAGVVPGGLTANAEIKILICHVLREIAQPISREDLLEALTARGYANYFECTQALGDLLETGHVARDARGMLSATESGKETAELLASDVALTVRERAVQQARILARRSSPQNAARTELSRLEAGGYRLRCTLNDKEGEVFALELLAPAMPQAKRMQEVFSDNAEEIVRALYSRLTGGEF